MIARATFLCSAASAKPAIHESVTGPSLPVHVVGATGRSGAALCRALVEAGESIVPVLRNAAKWHGLGLPGSPRIADLRNPEALRRALGQAVLIATCVHARWTPDILAAAPTGAALVLMGSTRRFSRWPDIHGEGVRAGEAALLASGRPGIMLHPTMIYGSEGENNVQRLAALARRLPVAPLPGGGRALVQPIHQDDVTRCLLAALRRPARGPETLVIAGPEPVAYRDFFRQVARSAGIRPPPILPVPAPLLRLLVPLTRLVPGLPHIGADEIRRLTEDKAFDIGPMLERLGVQPMPLAEGLARTFGPCSAGW